MIRVKGVFVGAESNEKAIYPGTYDENDPLLFGLANYLVSNGHAVLLDGQAFQTETPEGQPPVASDTANEVIHIVELDSENRPVAKKRK